MEQESGSKIYLTVVLLYENILNHFLDFQRNIIFLRKIPTLRKQSHLLAAASNATNGREQRYLRPRVALPTAASRQLGMGIGKTSDRDREKKRAAKTHGCVWRHAEFMNVVMSSLGQTLCHQAASCTRFLPSTR